MLPSKTKIKVFRDLFYTKIVVNIHIKEKKRRFRISKQLGQDGKIFFSKNSYCLATFSSDPKRKTILNFLTELIPCFMCIIQTYTYQFLKISLQKFSESTFPFPRFFAQLFLMKVFILPVILTPASKVFFKKRTKSNTTIYHSIIK